MANLSTVTQKGQIVIPVEIREKLKLKKGTRVSFRIEEGAIKVQPLTDDYINSLFGSSKTNGKALRSLFKDKKAEREL